jgi:hypothetical protein
LFSFSACRLSSLLCILYFAVYAGKIKRALWEKGNTGTAAAAAPDFEAMEPLDEVDAAEFEAYEVSIVRII